MALNDDQPQDGDYHELAQYTVRDLKEALIGLPDEMLVEIVFDNRAAHGELTRIYKSADFNWRGDDAERVILQEGGD